MAAASRTRNPRGQGEKLRAGLLDAARGLLLELGDQERLSVRAVTARAGVSPNALYLHFAGREELLNTVLEAAYGELRAFLQEAAQAKAEPFEKLRSFALAYLRFAAEQPGIYRVLFMTKLREGVPMPDRDATTAGQDEGVDTFNDLLSLVAACDPGWDDQFTRSAELWAALHGYVALRQVMPAFPWPSDTGYVEHLIELHVGRPPPVER